MQSELEKAHMYCRKCQSDYTAGHQKWQGSKLVHYSFLSGTPYSCAMLYKDITWHSLCKYSMTLGFLPDYRNEDKVGQFF